MNRRGFLLGGLAAPLVVTTPGVLMPVKSLHEYTYCVYSVGDYMDWKVPPELKFLYRNRERLCNVYYDAPYSAVSKLDLKRMRKWYENTSL